MKTKTLTKSIARNVGKIKKSVFSLYTAFSSMAMMTMPVFAAGTVDATGFVSKAETVLKTLIILIGAGLALFGVVNLLEAYGNNNPGDRSQGIKQLVAGIGLIICGIALVPVLGNMMSGAL